jgi:L-ascorbate metabolism protein UlaG (beta-lactamase superfamily)
MNNPTIPFHNVSGVDVFLRFSLILITYFSTIFMLASQEAFGTYPDNELKTHYESISPQHDGYKFFNKELTKTMNSSKMLEVGAAYIQSDSKARKPGKSIRRMTSEQELIRHSENVAFSMIWLGHSTVWLNVQGKRILLDPVFSQRVSPTSFAGPKRLFASPIKLAQLPQKIEAVLISHDHYDHLDLKTIKYLKDRVNYFYVPLGNRPHLEGWGISPDKIIELDWWQSFDAGGLKITCTPARHFSGRGLKRDQTLWSSWAIATPNMKIFYGGDSGITDQFAEIGKRFGAFDLAIMPIGAYNPAWHDIHLDPEEAVLATRQVNAKSVLPVHWSTFDLALHPWAEPIDRFLKSIKDYPIKVLLPAPGEPITLHDTFDKKWYETYR